MTALLSGDMDSHSEKEDFIQNNNSSKQGRNFHFYLLFIFVLTGKLKKKKNSVNATLECVRSLFGSVDTHLTRIHKHTYVQIHQRHKRHVCHAYPDMCAYVCVPSVQSVYGC